MQLIILDRDGVINRESDDYIRGVRDWHPIPGSIEAIAALSRAGYQVAIDASAWAEFSFTHAALAFYSGAPVITCQLVCVSKGIDSKPGSSGVVRKSG